LHFDSSINSTQEIRSDKIKKLIVSLITQLCTNNELLVARAMRVFNRLGKTKIPRIKKDELLASACTFIALRDSNTPYSYSELAKLCENVTKRELGRCCKRCFVYLQYDSAGAKTSITTSPLQVHAFSILDNVPRYASCLGFTRTEIMHLKNMSKFVEKSGIIRGCNPLSIVAAVFIYVAEHIGLSLISLRVANVIGIAENTVLKSYSFLTKCPRDFFPVELNEKLEELKVVRNQRKLLNQV